METLLRRRKEENGSIWSFRSDYEGWSLDIV